MATDLLGVSAREMIEALIAGQRDPVVLADLAKRRMRAKIPELRRALVGRFGEHHAAMLRLHLEHIDHLDALIDQLDVQIDAKLDPFAHQNRDDDSSRHRPSPSPPRLTDQRNTGSPTSGTPAPNERDIHPTQPPRLHAAGMRPNDFVIDTTGFVNITIFNNVTVHPSG